MTGTRPSWSRQNIAFGGGFAFTVHLSSTCSPNSANVIPDAWIRGATRKRKFFF